MESFEKISVLSTNVTADNLIFLFILITIATLALFIIVTTIVGGSLWWLAVFVLSTFVYLAYAYHLIYNNQTKQLDMLVNAMIVWSVAYIVLQGIYVAAVVL